MAKKKVADVTTFTTAELIASADAFGVSREVMAGALHGKKNASREEAGALVTAFRKREVKV